MSKEKKRRLLLGTAYISGLLLLVVYLHGIYMDWILLSFSSITYQVLEITVFGWEKLLIFFIYTVIAFFWTFHTAQKIGKKGLFFWLLNWALDFLILPLSVLFVVVYYNLKRPLGVVYLNSVENFFLIGALLTIKHVLFYMCGRNAYLSKGGFKRH
jgi:hypothetical protein